ncbi:hypothetical protein LCGC14_3129210, partial [marine sediment metagenome]
MGLPRLQAAHHNHLQGGDVDLSKIEPYTGPILFGAEKQEPVDEDAVSKVEEVPTGAPEPTPAAKAPMQDLAAWVAARLQSGETIDAKGLFEAAAGYFGGTAGEGKFDPRDAYDALEAGVNMHLTRTRAHIPKGSVEKA